MTSGLNSRWLATVLIWSAVVMVSYLNLAKIQEVRSIRENNDRLRKEMRFQHRNAAQLDRVRSIQNTRRMPVASANLGFESVRSRLYALASGMGFDRITIDGQMEQATEGRLPIRLNMKGTFEKAANFITALQSVPYLSLKKSRVQVARTGPDAEIELNFDFGFTIAPARPMDIPPLQAAANPVENKATTR
jgi:Tfp pilus assembly protein PilO